MILNVCLSNFNYHSMCTVDYTIEKSNKERDMDHMVVLGYGCLFLGSTFQLLWGNVPFIKLNNAVTYYFVNYLGFLLN